MRRTDKDRAADRRYNCSEKGKAARRRYLNTTKGKFSRRKHDLKTRNGVTPDRYNQMFTEQNGICAICGEKEVFRVNGEITSLVIDHNHETDEIRGLLCRACNLGLGNFKDNLDNLHKAIIYMKERNVPT